MLKTPAHLQAPATAPWHSPTVTAVSDVWRGSTAPVLWMELRCCPYLELLDAKHVWGGGGQHVLPNPGLLVNVHRTDRVAGEELIVDPPCLLGQLRGQEARLRPAPPPLYHTRGAPCSLQRHLSPEEPTCPRTSSVPGLQNQALGTTHECLHRCTT